jgi:hypothetical protein
VSDIPPEDDPRPLATVHSICATFTVMKLAQLPPVRVQTSVRQTIEAALREGESLSQFIEAAALDAARQRQAQAAFVARGRASLERVRQGARVTDVEPALAAMADRMATKLASAKAGSTRPPKKR